MYNNHLFLFVNSIYIMWGTGSYCVCIEIYVSISLASFRFVLFQVLTYKNGCFWIIAYFTIYNALQHRYLDIIRKLDNYFYKILT